MTYTIRNWDTATKDCIRKKVCTVKSTNVPYKKILLLPGSTCLDLKLLMQLGAISPTTKIYVVERDKKVIETIKNTIKSFLPESQTVIYLNKDLHLLDLAKFSAAQKFDFIYLDTCGQLNIHIVSFLLKIAENYGSILTEDGTFALNISNWARGGAGIPREITEFWKWELFTEEKILMTTILARLFGDKFVHHSYKNDGSPFTMHTFLWKSRQIVELRQLKEIRTFIATVKEKRSKRNTLTKNVMADFPYENLSAGKKDAITRKKNQTYVKSLEDKIDALESKLDNIISLLSKSSKLVC